MSVHSWASVGLVNQGTIAVPGLVRSSPASALIIAKGPLGLSFAELTSDTSWVRDTRRWEDIGTYPIQSSLGGKELGFTHSGDWLKCMSSSAVYLNAIA